MRSSGRPRSVFSLIGNGVSEWAVSCQSLRTAVEISSSGKKEQTAVHPQSRRCCGLIRLTYRQSSCAWPSFVILPRHQGAPSPWSPPRAGQSHEAFFVASSRDNHSIVQSCADVKWTAHHPPEPGANHSRRRLATRTGTKTGASRIRA